MYFVWAWQLYEISRINEVNRLKKEYRLMILYLTVITRIIKITVTTYIIRISQKTDFGQLLVRKWLYSITYS
jgi:hypothetical protein